MLHAMSRPAGASENCHGRIAVELDADLVRQLRPAAAARNTNAQRLIADVIRVAVADNLISAILDDEK
jgi:hypothetical protein